jgi:diguanylate cyclase (GGDEF)-like protein
MPNFLLRSHRRVVPWAAIGFSLLWGTVVGIAVSEGDLGQAIFGAAGMLLTLTLTAYLYREQTELRNLAETDSLTGLTNHRGFQQALRRELQKAGETGESLSLVILDLDDFKAINELHGHPFGDGVLEGVGVQLRRSVRGGDTAARTGGEQFGLILPGTDADAAQEIAERVRRSIENLAPADSQLSSSAGVAVYPVDADTPDALLQLAEGALYWAKRSGKGPDAAVRPRPRSAQRRRAAADRDRADPPGTRNRTRLPARRIAHHRAAPRLRGTGPVPRRARPAPLHLVRTGERLRPGAEARGRGDPRSAPDGGPPARRAHRGQRQPVGTLHRGRHERPPG